jgi:hypothetical protein
MTTDRTTKSSWLFTLVQLTIVSLSVVLIFALAYWSLDALDLGGLQERNGERVAGFLPFLYFSVETFFRIGYGIQTPVGLAWAIVTLEAMSHFLIEVVFIAHMATLGLHRLISLSDRTRLENTLNRF